MERQERISWVILCVALAIIFHRLLFGDVLFWGLPSLQFIPWRIEAMDQIWAGQFPFWNSLSGGGAPLFANYQSSLMYPFSWLSLFLAIPQSMSLTVVLHLAIAGLGMSFFTRALGISSFGQGVSTLAFGLTTYLTARAGTFPIIQVVAWLPWLLWAAALLVEQVTLRRVGWLAVFTALLLLAGHAQTAWYALLLTGLFTLMSVLAQRSWQLGTWTLLLAAFGVILGAGVAAFQLFGTAELLVQSQRAGGVDYDFAMNLSYAPARILNLLSPNVFGTPAEGTYITGGAFFEDSVYIGMIPLFCALAAVIGWGLQRIRRVPTAEVPLAARFTPFWLIVVLVGMVLAMGRHTAIFPFLFENVPTFDFFQAPARWHLWTVTGLSVLAGIGVSYWGRAYHTRRWAMRGTVAAGSAVILATTLLIIAPSSIAAVNLLTRAVIYAGILGVLAGVLTLSQPARTARSFGGWMTLVLLVIAGDLGYAAWGLNPTTSADFYRPQPPSDWTSRRFWEAETLDTARFETFLRFDNYQTVVLNIEAYRSARLPNINMLDGVSLFNNFDPLLADSYSAYFDLLDQEASPGLLRAAAVGALVDVNGLTPAPDAHPARAWLVSAACWHTTPEALARALVEPTWNPEQQIHLLGDAGCAVPQATAGEVQITQEIGGRLEVTVDTERDAWLVVADSDYPGWSATVDGEETPIYRANLAFRAVQIQAGSHTVNFSYQPAWVLPGLLVSITSFILALLFLRLRTSEV